jgi:hypothetical protein
MDNNNVHGEGLNPLLRTVMIIHFALGMGVFLFATVVFVLSANAQPAVNPDMALHEMMAYITVIFCFSATPLSFILFPNLINKNKSIFTDIPANRYQIFQSAHIVRMAMLESMALFGLVALILYVMNIGPLNSSIEVLLPAIPVIIFFMLWIYLFPSEQKIRDAVGIE